MTNQGGENRQAANFFDSSGEPPTLAVRILFTRKD